MPSLFVALTLAAFTADPLPDGAVARLGTDRMRNLGDPGDIRWHPDGKRLIVPVPRERKSTSEEFALIDPRTGDDVGRLDGGKTTQWFLAMSADGTRWVSGEQEFRHTVRDTATGKEVYTQPKGTEWDHLVCLSADGTRLGRGDRRDFTKPDDTVRLAVIDLNTGKELAAFEPAQTRYAELTLSADGKRAVSWGDGERIEDDAASRVVQFWDVNTGKELGRGEVSGREAVKAVALAPAGDRAAASGGDGAVVVFDTTSGKRVRELLGTARVGVALAFSADGKTLAAASWDGHVQLWEVATSCPGHSPR